MGLTIQGEDTDETLGSNDLQWWGNPGGLSSPEVQGTRPAWEVGEGYLEEGKSEWKRNREKAGREGQG